MFENKYKLSRKGSDSRISQKSGHSTHSNHSSVHNDDDTKYTFNPITEKRKHIFPKLLTNSESKFKPSSDVRKMVSPMRWKLGNQDVKFSYANRS